MGMRKFCHAKPGCRFIMLVTVPETRLFRQSSFRRIGNPYRMSPWSRQIFSITKKKTMKREERRTGNFVSCLRSVRAAFLSLISFVSIDRGALGWADFINPPIGKRESWKERIWGGNYYVFPSFRQLWMRLKAARHCKSQTLPTTTFFLSLVLFGCCDYLFQPFSSIRHWCIVLASGHARHAARLIPMYIGGSIDSKSPFLPCR